MRLTKTVAAGAVALSALVTLTGCGGNDNPTDDLGLPEASDMTSLQKVVEDRGVSCTELQTTSSGAVEEMEKEAKDPAWSIKERGICKGAPGEWIVLLSIDDMSKFQTALSQAQAKGQGDAFLVGKNFAIAPQEEDTVAALMQGGLLMMSCDPKHREGIPSGSKVHEAQVKPCFLTDRIS
ncbi:hypothetical protein ACGFYP_26565 [Streptomyces sp. NPDC048370]|uniref:hypothetical protein n=1 Tax=Streptomyces sp. NPDC048370 TaxID=3365540 RepID=UPI00371DF7DB